MYKVYCSLVVTCWERANLLALLYVMFSCVFVTFPSGVLGQVWYLIVLIPDLWLRTLKQGIISLLDTTSCDKVFFLSYFPKKYKYNSKGADQTADQQAGLSLLFAHTKITFLCNTAHCNSSGSALFSEI